MFKVKLHRRVIKFLQKLNENDRKRIFSAIEKLEDPFSQLIIRFSPPPDVPTNKYLPSP